MCCRKQRLGKGKLAQKLQQQQGSLKQLKQQMRDAAAVKQATPAHACRHSAAEGNGRAASAADGAANLAADVAEAGAPLEQTRVLTQEDFQRIRKLKVPNS